MIQFQSRQITIGMSDGVRLQYTVKKLKSKGRKLLRSMKSADDTSRSKQLSLP